MKYLSKAWHILWEKDTLSSLGVITALFTYLIPIWSSLCNFFFDNKNSYQCSRSRRCWVLNGRPDSPSWCSDSSCCRAWSGWGLDSEGSTSSSSEPCCRPQWGESVRRGERSTVYQTHFLLYNKCSIGQNTATQACYSALKWQRM